MNFLIICAIFFSCWVIGLKNGSVAVFALFLCLCSFIFGAYVYHSYLKDKVKNGELLELNGKYYAVKYVKDKVE